MESELFVAVVDEDGGALPGAAGTLKSERMQGVRKDASNARGQMRFRGLAPGDYDLTVKLAGFRTAREDDIPIRRDEPRQITITLQIAKIES